MSIPADRLRDLVRQMRHPLHQEDLITDEEYAELLNIPGAVARLESYDEVRARLKAANSEIAELRTQLAATLHGRTMSCICGGEAQRDSERLNLLHNAGDIGEILIDADLPGQLEPLRWNKWLSPQEGHSSIRAALDARAKEKP